jgi:triosephosphate isomerase
MSEQRIQGTRVPLIAGNWKMNMTSDEGAHFVGELVRAIRKSDDREVVVAPAFTGLAAAAKAAQGSGLMVAAQDVFWEQKGAYTGEVSVGMLSGVGASGAIVGHSERRGYFGETDEQVAKKVEVLLAAGLQPIMCVGEKEQEREGGLTEEVLARQVPAGLSAVDPAQAAGMCIAYEPIWAIGTGRTATPEVAQEAIAFVRRQVAETLGGSAADSMRILYGGSVTPENIDILMHQPDIDGALVGGASLKVESFARIVDFQEI